jgi:hypothetical protein
MAKIIINDRDNVIPLEPQALHRAIDKLTQYDPEHTHAILTVPRGEIQWPEWLEWTLIVNADVEGHFVPGQSMVLGMVQRKRADEFEFCS